LFTCYIYVLWVENPVPEKFIAGNFRIGNIPQLSVTGRKENLNILNFINVIDLTVTD
jgi:hypothetical protein